LLRLKRAKNSALTFIPDHHDISHFPLGAHSEGKSPTDTEQTCQANGAVLATLDENIPGSYLIPK